MRFKDYITGRNNKYVPIDIINDMLVKCKPFLNDLLRGGLNNLADNSFLFSGMKGIGDYEIIKNIKDRHPKNTSLDVHNYFDNAFYKKFGFRARSNSIFCSGKSGVARNYGKVYMIFPIGKYRFIWSPIVYDLYTHPTNVNPMEVGTIRELSKDFIAKFYSLEKNDYIELAKEYEKKFGDNDSKKKEEYIKKRLGSVIDKHAQKILDSIYAEFDRIIDTYTNKDLPKAIKMGKEIMVNCNEFYAIYIGNDSENAKLLYNYFKKYGTSEATKEKLDDIKGTL